MRLLDGHHITQVLVWSLSFGASLELGTWGLVFWCPPYSPKTAKIHPKQVHETDCLVTFVLPGTS
jgi:hypothetical protein